MENLPTPLSRVELYLAKACGMDVTVPEQPLSRLEQFLAILAGDTSITMPTPMSLTEQWLAYVLGVTPDPLLAVEGACLIGAQKVDVRYFAVAASMPGATLPEAPQNRAEMYWAHIAGNPPTPGILKYVTGKYFYLTDVVSGIEELQYVKGDTYQQTYSGANLYNYTDTLNVGSGITVDDNGFISVTGESPSSSTTNVYKNYFTNRIDLETSTSYAVVAEVKSVSGTGRLTVTSNNQVDTAYSQIVENKTVDFASLTSNAVIVYIVTSRDSFSSPEAGLRSYVQFRPGESGSITFRLSVLADTSITPETFVYQPYTGGIPAPNPDYPQPIQVVTGEQTVTITGKNLINIPNFTASQQGITAKCSNQTIELTGTAGNTYYPDFRFYKDGTYGTRAYRSTVNQIDTSKGFFTEPNSEYKLSIFVEGNTPYAIVEGFETKVTNNLGLVGNQVITINDSERLNFVSISISQNVTADVKVRIQIEKGSTATAYEPYQVQSYTIDLGATELCKISDYQDYIYPSNGDWYVRKDIGKVTINGSYGGYNGTFNWYYCTAAQYGGESPSSSAVCVGNLFRYIPFVTFKPNASLIGMSVENGGFRLRNTACSSASDYQNWLSNNNLILYYQLATPTDTKITDATLVGQLNALDSAVLPKPIANITVSATGTNLTPYLTIAYYGSDEE